MAEFFVRHSLNPNLAVKFNITLRYFVVASEKGEHTWVLEIGTTYPSASGTAIPAKEVHLVSLSTVDDVIEDAVSSLCGYIDWSPLLVDVLAPNIADVYPVGPDVPMPYSINFTIAERLSSAGVDLSDVKVFLNNSDTTFDITSECKVDGDPSSYEFTWVPKVVVYNPYE